MKCASHLCLEAVELAPSAEWRVECAGWCFIRVIRQHGYWLGENGAQELGPGQVAALLPLREGCFRASQIGAVTLEHFRFAPELAGGLLTLAEHDIFEALAGVPRHAVRVFAADSPGAALWARLAARPIARNTLLHRIELLRVVATLFADEWQRPGPAEKTVLSSRLKLRLLVNQMPETEFLRLTPRELAARCGVSMTQTNRSFRKLFGLSLGDRQELIRLQRARQALMETTSPLTALAAEAGYRDVAEFTAVFKRQFGMTPSEWRRPRLRRGKLRVNGAAGGARSAAPRPS